MCQKADRPSAEGGTAVNMKPFIFCEGFCADRSVSAVGNAGCLETVRPEGCIHL